MADESNFLSRALAARMRGYNGAGVISAALNTDDYQDMERQRIERENYMAEQMQQQRQADSFKNQQAELALNRMRREDVEWEKNTPIREQQRKEANAVSKANEIRANMAINSAPKEQEYRDRKRQSEMNMLDMKDEAAKTAFGENERVKVQKSIEQELAGDERVRSLTTSEYESMKNDPKYKELVAFKLAGRLGDMARKGASPFALGALKDLLAEYDFTLGQDDKGYYVDLPDAGEGSNINGQGKRIYVDSSEYDAALDGMMQKWSEMREDMIDAYHQTSFNNTNGFAPGRIRADWTLELQNAYPGMDRDQAFKHVNNILKDFSGRDVRAMCLSQALNKAMEDGNFESEELQGMLPFFMQDGWKAAGDISNPSSFRFSNPSMGIKDINVQELQKVLKERDRVTPAFEAEKQALKARYDAGIQEQNLKMLKRIKQDIGGGDEGQTQTNGNEGQILNNNLGSSWYGVKAVSRKKLKEANVAVGETLDTFENLGIGERDENSVFNFNHNIPFDALKQAAEAEQDIASDNGIDTDNARFHVKPLYDKVKTVVDVFNFMIDSHYRADETARTQANNIGRSGRISGLVSKESDKASDIVYEQQFKFNQSRIDQERSKEFDKLVNAMRGKNVDLGIPIKGKRKTDTNVDSRKYLSKLHDWLKPYMTPEMEQKYKQAMQDEDWDYGRKGGAKKK